MIPETLMLEGFLSYREKVVVDLSAVSVACVSGANGAGKSTLFDAITWALFGKARRMDDALIHDGLEACRVNFEFTYENSRYRVDRTKPRAKAALLEFQMLKPDGTWKVLTEAGIRATEQKISTTLRLDYETFVNAAFFLQGKADLFAQQTPGKRKELLSNILGLEVWEEYREEASGRRRAAEEELAANQRMVTEIDQELDQEPERKRDLEQMESLLKKTSTLRGVKENQLLAIQEKAAKLRSLREKLEMTSDQADVLQRRMGDMNKRLAEVEKESQQQDSLLENEQTIKEQFAQFQQARKDLESWNLLAERINHLRVKREKLQTQIETEKARLTQECDSLQQQGKEIKTESIQVSELAEKIQMLSAQSDALSEAFSQQEPLEEAIQEKTKEKADRIGQKQHAREKMDELQARIESLGKNQQSACPLCGQDLTDHHREELLIRLSDEGKKLGDQYRQNVEETNNLQQELSRLQAELVDLRKKRPLFQQTQQHLHTLQQQVVHIQERQNIWQKNGDARLQDLRKQLDGELFKQEERTQADLITKKIEDLGYSHEKHQHIRAVVEDLSTVEEHFHKVETARTVRGGLLREKKSLEKQLENLMEDISQNTLIQQSLQNDLAGIGELDADIDDAHAQLETIRKEENELRSQVGAARQLVSVLSNQKKRKKKIEKQAALLKKRIARLKMLDLTFGKDGVPAMLIEQSIPEIESQANEILDRLSDGTMSVSLETERAYKDKNRSDKRQTLDIMISDLTGQRPYELFSGGEAFRINFSIRLALSRVLSQRAGARLQTLVIDEGFGSQDADGRQRLIEAINMVSPDFEKILVITHLEELKDAFPSRIEVVKTPAGSQVEVIA